MKQLLFFENFPNWEYLLKISRQTLWEVYVRSIVHIPPSKKQSFSWCGSQNSEWKYTVWVVPQYHLKENKYCQRFQKNTNNSITITFSIYKNLNFIWWWIWVSLCQTISWTIVVLAFDQLCKMKVTINVEYFDQNWSAQL